MLDMRKRVFGNIWTQAAQGEVAGISLSALLQRLLLFETSIIDSNLFEEIPHLVRCFGYKGAVALLQSGAVRVRCEPTYIGRLGGGDATPRPSKTRQGAIRVQPLRYAVFNIGQQDELGRTRLDVDAGLRRVTDQIDLTERQAVKLENLVRGRLLPRDPNARLEAFQLFQADVTGTRAPLLTSVELAFTKEFPHRSFNAAYSLAVSGSDGDLCVETDFGVANGLSDTESVSILRKGIDGTIGLYEALEDMHKHSAMIGFQPAEVPVLERKLDNLALQLSAPAQGKRLSRVLQLCGLPDLSEAHLTGTVDIQKLLRIRESEDCRTFRDWLWSSDDVSNAEIEKQFRSIRGKLGDFVRSPAGRTLRWLTTQAIGMVPSAGPFVGAVGGLLDHFVTEAAFKRPGAISFLSRQYPTIFRPRQL